MKLRLARVIAAAKTAAARGITKNSYALILIIIVTQFPLKSYAVSGLQGLFKAGNWQYAVNGVDTSTPDNCDEYAISVDNCIEISAPQGAFDMLQQNTSEGETYSTFYWENIYGGTYTVNFDYAYDNGNGNGNAVFGIANGNIYDTENWSQITTITDPTATTSLTPYLTISPGETLFFTTVVPSSSDPSTQLSITEFNYAVPSPLPATGAAAAFGYSRRLRRRIKGKPVIGSRPKPRTPAHPVAYLNLAPGNLQSLPLSFSYARLPDRRFSLSSSSASSSSASASDQQRVTSLWATSGEASVVPVEAPQTAHRRRSA